MELLQSIDLDGKKLMSTTPRDLGDDKLGATRNLRSR